LEKFGSPRYVVEIDGELVFMMEWLMSTDVMGSFDEVYTKPWR
jgi:hypothetical protein